MAPSSSSCSLTMEMIMKISVSLTRAFSVHHQRTLFVRGLQNKLGSRQISPEQTSMSRNNQIACKDHLKQLWNQNKPKEAELYFTMIVNKSGVHWNQMIAGYAKIGDEQTARKYFDDLMAQSVSHGTTVNIGSFNPLLYLHSKNSNPKAMQELLEKARQLNIQLDNFSYASLMSYISKQGDIKAMREIINKVQEGGLHMDLVLFNSVLATCGRAGDIKLMRSYFNSIGEEWGLEPNLITKSILLTEYGRKGLMNDALNIFRSIDVKEMNSKIVNAMLKVLINNKKWHVGEQIFKEMYEDESTMLKPDFESYNRCLLCIANSGDPERALQFFKKMRDANIEPNEITFNNLMISFVKQIKKAGVIDFDRLHNTFLDMKNWGFAPNEATAKLLLRAFASAGYHKRLCEYFGQLVDAGMQPTEDMFQSVFHAYASDYVPSLADKRDLVSVLQQTLVLMKTYKLDISIVIHNICLLALGNAGLTEEMLQHIEYLEAVGQPKCNDVTYRTVISALIRQEKYEQAWLKFKHMSTVGIDYTPVEYQLMQSLISRCSASAQSLDAARDRLAVACPVMWYLLNFATVLPRVCAADFLNIVLKAFPDSSQAPEISETAQDPLTPGMSSPESTLLAIQAGAIYSTCKNIYDSISRDDDVSNSDERHTKTRESYNEKKHQPKANIALGNPSNRKDLNPRSLKLQMLRLVSKVQRYRRFQNVLV